MNIPIVWQTSMLSSALHAARQLVAGWPVHDARIVAAVSATAQRLDKELAEILTRLPSPRTVVEGRDLWHCLLELSLNDPPVGELAARLASRLGLVSSTAASTEVRVAAVLAELQSEFLGVLPRLADELPLRVGPLRDQWEARGPGWCARAARLTQLPLATLAPRVVLVHPVLGGGGTPFFSANAVQFEAILVNARAELPEALRLGWLLLQLAAWPSFAAIPEPRRRKLIAAATLPPALTAGQYVELAPPSPRLIHDALAAWFPDPLPLAVQDHLASMAGRSDASDLSWLDQALALDPFWT